MSIPPPPGSPIPPPPGGLPPAPPYGAAPPPYGAAPAGYVPYGAAGPAPLRPVGGLGKAMIVLYGVASLVALLLGFVMVSRGGTVTDFFNRRATLSDVGDADAAVVLLFLLFLVVILAAAILTCLWANRVSANAKARGINTSPGLAGGGWFIPIGWFFVGFNELRKSGRGMGVATGGLIWWQVAFAGQMVLSVISRTSVDDTRINLANAGDRFTQQGYIQLLSAACYVVATVFAAKTAKRFAEAR